MKKGDKRKQQKVLKKRSEKKQIATLVTALRQTSPLFHIRQARNYPLEGCWINEGWQEGGLATIVVARRQPNGNIVYGCYLVDVFCLGVKNAFCNADIPVSQFRREVLPKAVHGDTPQPISVALAHEIIYGAIEYAAQWGFRPHRDYKQAQPILDLPDAHEQSGKVEFGKDGKPLYVSGPYDNPDAIVRQLGRTAGAGNYDYLVGLGGPSDLDDWDEGEEWSEDEEWDDEDEQDDTPTSWDPNRLSKIKP